RRVFGVKNVFWTQGIGRATPLLKTSTSVTVHNLKTGNSNIWKKWKRRRSFLWLLVLRVRNNLDGTKAEQRIFKKWLGVFLKARIFQSKLRFTVFYIC